MVIPTFKVLVLVSHDFILEVWKVHPKNKNINVFTVDIVEQDSDRAHNVKAQMIQKPPLATRDAKTQFLRILNQQKSGSAMKGIVTGQFMSEWKQTVKDKRERRQR